MLIPFSSTCLILLQHSKSAKVDYYSFLLPNGFKAAKLSKATKLSRLQNYQVRVRNLVWRANQGQRKAPEALQAVIECQGKILQDLRGPLYTAKYGAISFLIPVSSSRIASAGPGTWPTEVSVR
ncbi:MAG TPA: hypothetical protein VIY47_05440 [Ignavibacteriaceae bacterium]